MSENKNNHILKVLKDQLFLELDKPIYHDNWIIPKEVITNSISYLKHVNKTVFSTLEETGDNIGENIPFEKVSHIASNFHIKHGKLYGDIEILDSPCGRIFMEKVNDVDRFILNGICEKFYEKKVTFGKTNKHQICYNIAEKLEITQIVPKFKEDTI